MMNHIPLDILNVFEDKAETIKKRMLFCNMVLLDNIFFTFAKIFWVFIFCKDPLIIYFK